MSRAILPSWLGSRDTRCLGVSVFPWVRPPFSLPPLRTRLHDNLTRHTSTILRCVLTNGVDTTPTLIIAYRVLFASTLLEFTKQISLSRDHSFKPIRFVKSSQIGVQPHVNISTHHWQFYCHESSTNRKSEGQSLDSVTADEYRPNNKRRERK